MEGIRDTIGEILETRMGQFGAGAIAVAGTLAASFYLRRPTPFPIAVDPQRQSLDLGGGVRACPLITELKGQKLVEWPAEDAKTLHEIFLSGLKKSRHGKCLGKRSGPNREFEWITYQQVYDRARAFASGLLDLGLKPQPDSYIGIYSANRIEWVIAEQGCNAYSMVIVPLYDTLGPTACQYVINLMEMTTVVCDTADRVQNLLHDAEKMKSLKHIIVMDTIPLAVSNKAKQHGFQLHSFTDIEARGKTKLQVPVPPKPSDLATVCFTSGTTGNPKGVMLTHANLAAEMGGFTYILFKQRGCTPDECHLSYLPLAHMFERGIQMFIFFCGGHIGFFSGDITLLFDDLQTLKPTLFPVVPRLLNRVRDKILASVQASWLKSFLFEWALSSKMAEVRRGIIRRDSIWDKLVFRKVREMYGGRIDYMISGSAPLSAETLNFFKCTLGCMVVEAYGQTEAVAAISTQFPGDTTDGHVGTPLICNYVKLVDIPEMEYYVADNKGEVCAKGPNVFHGYFKNPEKTAEVIDDEGWLHTGDVGLWLPNGALKIIDRKKHIFKLSQGEYVAPEKIEAIYVRSQFVAQVFLDGNSLQTCCMAVVVPDAEVMALWAPNNGFPKDMEQLCKSEAVKDIILKDLHAQGKKEGLKGFEQVKDIFLHPEPFSVDNGLLTPTFKGKRPQLRVAFKHIIDELYARNNM